MGKHFLQNIILRLINFEKLCVIEIVEIVKINFVKTFFYKHFFPSKIIHWAGSRRVRVSLME